MAGPHFRRERRLRCSPPSSHPSEARRRAWPSFGVIERRRWEVSPARRGSVRASRRGPDRGFWAPRGPAREGGKGSGPARAWGYLRGYRHPAVLLQWPRTRVGISGPADLDEFTRQVAPAREWGYLRGGTESHSAQLGTRVPERRARASRITPPPRIYSSRAPNPAGDRVPETTNRSDYPQPCPPSRSSGGRSRLSRGTEAVRSLEAAADGLDASFSGFPPCLKRARRAGLSQSLCLKPFIEGGGRSGHRRPGRKKGAAQAESSGLFRQ